jgi:O-phospho-L-seryl-tRNASec:L-selenocysteinyl-tRNA synthase
VAGTGKPATVGGITFQNYGAHHDTYPHTYLTAAAAVGGTLPEVKDFCSRVVKVLNEVTAKAALNRERRAPNATEDAAQVAGKEVGGLPAQQQEGQQDGGRPGQIQQGILS